MRVEDAWYWNVLNSLKKDISMRVEDGITHIYVCEVCETPHYHEYSAEKCEKLPVEKQILEEGDEVRGRESTGVVLDVDLISPLGDAGNFFDSIPRGKHFYVYAIRWQNGSISEHLKRDLEYSGIKKK